jgi:hypothetical protein
MAGGKLIPGYIPELNESMKLGLRASPCFSLSLSHIASLLIPENLLYLG